MSAKAKAPKSKGKSKAKKAAKPAPKRIATKAEVIASLDAVAEKRPDLKNEIALARKVMASGIKPRHSSAQFAKTHKNGVTDAERMAAAKLLKGGVPYRKVEVAFRLYPASGNDALRMGKAGERLLDRQRRAKAKKAAEATVKAPETVGAQA